MVEYEVFPNAPVEEAIITIRVPRIVELTAGLERLHLALSNSYPVAEESGSADNISHRFLSADRQQVVQVTSTMFSFHRLRPYLRWELFVADARSAWTMFDDVFSPELLVDVRLRYINALNLPSGTEWNEYLAIHPNLPPAVDTGLSSYLMSLNLIDRTVPATAVVTQSSEPTMAALAKVIYDIETRSLLPAASPYANTVWEILDGLREYKNRLFFEGLTERAKEMFR
jgi:uncharacterized protein (TIGR04255 family)